MKLFFIPIKNRKKTRRNIWIWKSCLDTQSKCFFLLDITVLKEFELFFWFYLFIGVVWWKFGVRFGVFDCYTSTTESRSSYIGFISEGLGKKEKKRGFGIENALLAIETFFFPSIIVSEIHSLFFSRSHSELSLVVISDKLNTYIKNNYMKK